MDCVKVFCNGNGTFLQPIHACLHQVLLGQYFNNLSSNVHLQFPCSCDICNLTVVFKATVSLDANHPPSGEDLTFEIQVVEIA